MGLFEIRVTVSERIRLGSQRSNMLTYNEDLLLIWDLCTKISSSSPETYKKYLRIKKKMPEQHSGWVMFVLAVLMQEENVFFFPCSVAFPIHLGWYLMVLVISPEMYKGECITHNLSLWCSLCWHKIQIYSKEDRLARSTDHNAVIRFPESLKWTLLLVIWCNCFIVKSEAKRVCLRLMMIK